MFTKNIYIIILDVVTLIIIHQIFYECFEMLTIFEIQQFLIIYLCML